MFTVFQFFGAPTGRNWYWISGAFLLGVVSGCLGIIDASREKWPVLLLVIDYERVQARIDELES